jgi:hypothetical protein
MMPAMALHPDFPRSPYEPLVPGQRWFPAAEELRASAYEKLPPLVANIREEVATWRAGGYPGTSPTSRALLQWWFGQDHLIEQAGSQQQFRYYYAQREAVETVIWLHDARSVRDKYDLLRFDASGAVSANMFDEQWPRYVLKLATGAGKTKVLSLLIAPNIIVLERLRSDFDGLRIFRTAPRGYLLAKKSIFSKVAGEANSDGFELTFAGFLDAASRAESGPECRFIYVDQPGFERNPPQTLAAPATAVREYQP